MEAQSLPGDTGMQGSNPVETADSFPLDPALLQPPPSDIAMSNAQTDAGPAPPASNPPALKVEDALTYLDAVKVQFADHPDVYNHFLDIMKNFKSQQIDTPGVIKRVSALFNGHPVLIQGFNTFLPMGYRIECSSNHTFDSVITVTTPTGTMTQTTMSGPGQGTSNWTETNPAEENRVPFPQGSMLLAEDHPPPAPPHMSPSPDPIFMQGVEEEAMEPAMQYVRKIRTRCDSATYKQFLEILAQYHHQPDTMDEREVSAQISRLFKDAPDLESDFRIFMPDKGGRGNGDGYRAPSKRKQEAAAQPPKKKRKVVQKEAAVPVPKAKKGKHTDAAASRAGPSSPHRVTATSAVAAPAQTVDSQFFERVKRTLDNREVYNEFLKLVNLFTQDLLDTGRLVRDSRNFLGDGDLWRQFREILGWDEQRERDNWALDNQQLGWNRPAHAGVVASRPSRAELNIRFGSYRRLPESETAMICSGRDDMCRSVLNDEWVSHPTWSSEDSGFVPHKKNVYEEALHRSEEERHEYDFHIEAIARTIATLEPINNKIAQLSPEERPTFKLKPNLGGSGKSIHHRVIKKIYGRDAGAEVILAMQETPAHAIPVVLTRLKQKEEEWKRAQREWNKVWREVDARNYHKSLDHQGISFKTADKKAITVKAFISQIEAAREEQTAKRASLIDPLFARTRPRHQLEFVVEDVNVLQDVLKMTFSFLDRTQAQIAFAERKRIEGFLRSFTAMFFMFDPAAFNASFAPVGEGGDSDMSDEQGSFGEDGESSSRSRNGSKRAGLAGGDLRKKLLKSEQAKLLGRKATTQDGVSPSGSRGASPVNADGMEIDESMTNGASHRIIRKNIFFSNTHFYALLRLIELLYSRLALFKGIAAKLASEPTKTRRPNPIADELGISTIPVIETPRNAEHYYDLLRDSCERLFDNELEQHAFEDQMRFMFGTKDAYKIFTVDKVIAAIIKQVQTICSDAKSQDLLDNLRRERAMLLPTTQDQINNRRNAEKILGPDENLFRIDWLAESKTITVQLLGKDDSSVDNSEVLSGRWQTYIDGYVSSDVTPGLTASRCRRPFLRRNVTAGASQGAEPPIVARGDLEIRVCVKTYRLFFVAATGDFMVRLSEKEDVQETSKLLQSRTAARLKWMEKAEASPLAS